MNQAIPCPFDRRSQDVGNLVEFGHVNVRVPDQQQATLFYVSGLGLTRDPFIHTGIDNMWINVGRCQFHLPTGAPQVLRGRVHLVLPDLPALLSRLSTVAPRLAGTGFGFEAHREHVDVRCPWGNRLRIHPPQTAFAASLELGMPCVEIDVAPGRAEPIARFYREMLASPGRVGRDADGVFADVPVGIGERLRFRETGRELPAYDGHHLQVSVADFSGVHRRLLERGLVTMETDESEYRFQDIVDLDSGAVLATIEHEVRSMRHPMFGRRLVNRDPSISNRAWAEGHESLRWTLPPGAR
ncbi:VOC family protein [Piscinibacter sakaiensis]|uniref:VOC family protein n=1 Tax=Piscinibacter sakaiensis TaxID=1547922 RepID=UPI003AAA7875